MLTDATSHTPAGSLVQVVGGVGIPITALQYSKNGCYLDSEKASLCPALRVYVSVYACVREHVSSACHVVPIDVITSMQHIGNNPRFDVPTCRFRE
jgi:hypothetical protein